MVTRGGWLTNRWVVLRSKNACHTHCDGPAFCARVLNVFEAIDRWENEGGAVHPSDVMNNTSTHAWPQLPQPQAEARRGPETVAALPGLCVAETYRDPPVGRSPGRDVR